MTYTVLVARLREAATSIRNDGTPAQVGLTEDECSEAATAIATLERERDEAEKALEAEKLANAELFSRAYEAERERGEAVKEVARYWTSADLTPWVDLAEGKGLGHFGKKLKGMFNRAMNAEASASAAERERDELKAEVAKLKEALTKVVADYDACSGAEPSLSVLHRSIDVGARTALGDQP